MPPSLRRRPWIALSLAAVALTALPQAQATGAPPVRSSASSVAPAPFPGVLGPQNPFVAPHGVGTAHNDSQSSDATPQTGPGAGPYHTSMAYGPTCPSTVMDSKGLLVGLCMDGHDKPSIRLMDPKTLAVLASIPQPPTSQYGVHFYIDPYDRTVISNGDGHILRVSHRQSSSGQWNLRVDDDWNLTRQVTEHCGAPRCDYLVSVKPDWAGRIWFSSLEGVVGTLNPRTGAVRTLHLPEGERVVKAISTSFRGVALASDYAVYLLRADARGRPRIVWREAYDRADFIKPGKWTEGSGTSPSFFGPGDDRYLALMDGGAPRESVRVYRVDARAGHRLLCTIPVFTEGASSTDDTFIVAGRSVIAVNTNGYDYFDYTPKPLPGGMTRIDVRKDESGCDVVWNNPTSTTTMAKLSMSKGIVYNFERTVDDAGVPTYSFMAIDAHTGKTLSRTPLGHHFVYEGLQLNGMLGPDGSYYQGVLGGMIRVSPAAG
ncbi:hypothetical protein SUDANB15_06677 [Streptomyces sp. enrichment culture]